MDWNENKSVRLSQACVVLFAVCLLLLDCLCYFAVRWFTGLRGMPWQTGKLMMLTIYLCSVFGWILLWKLWRLLANIRAQVIFDARNVALLRAVSWCWVADLSGERGLLSAICRDCNRSGLHGADCPDCQERLPAGDFDEGRSGSDDLGGAAWRFWSIWM